MKEYKNILIKNGKLESPALIKDLQKAEGIRVDITIEKHISKKRSIYQNRYLFGVVYEKALEYYRDNVGDFIRDLMSAVKADITKDFIHAMFKMWLHGGKTTTSMSTTKMMDYIEKIREHFLHQYGIDIPEPNQEEEN